MNNGIPKEVIDIVKDVLSSLIDVSKYKIFFFGSRVSGKANLNADIDLAVLGDEPLVPGVFSKIKESFEEARTVYTIDFVDLKRASASFRDEVLEGAVMPVF